MKRPAKSESVRRARQERNRLNLRWGIAGCSGVLGALLGGLVFYWILAMDSPPYQPGDAQAQGFVIWWYEFAYRWKLVLGAGATACVVWSWMRYEPRVRRQIAKASIDKLGLSFPITEVWEMNEDGLTHRLNEFESNLPWPTLQSLKELQDGFHLEFHETIKAFIPYRIFADAKERRCWRTRIRSHLNIAAQ